MTDYLMEKDWRMVDSASDCDMMIDWTRIGSRPLVICKIFVYSIGLSFRMVIPLLRGKIVTEQNVTIRHLPCPNRFVLFNVQLSPTYEIVFFMQFLLSFIKCMIMTMVNGPEGLFVMHISAQLEILIASMNRLVDERELRDVNNRLAVIV